MWRFVKGDGAKLLALYRRANLLERRVNGSSTADKAKLLAAIAKARTEIEGNDADEAKKTLDTVETELTPAPAGEDAGKAQGAAAAATAGRSFLRSEGFLSFLSIAAGFAVAALLVVTGFQTEYVDKGTTFGAGDFWDYFALAAWGFAAGMAGRAVGTSGSGGPTG